VSALAGGAAAGTGAGVPLAATPRARRTVAVWLLVCCALVAAMVVLGGVTRLTGSGLSMTTWKPIHGVVPPLTQAEWEQELDRYRASPEYRHRNAGMSIEAFQRIFWFEYAHRMLGRLIGLAFLVPLAWLLWKRMVERRLVPRLLLMFVLGGAQGLLGWWMVKSGLVDVPQVSHYRLSAHLGLALALYLWMLWTALGLLRDPPARAARTRGARAGLALLALGFVTALSGGLVAGLRAGLVYNTFPTMGGHWLPPELWALSPWWRNPFENVTTVQLDHRLLAALLLAGVAAAWVGCLRAPGAERARIWAHAAAAAMLVQLALGIATLLNHVPVALASLHQANALTLLTALAGLAHALRHPAPPTDRAAAPAR